MKIKKTKSNFFYYSISIIKERMSFNKIETTKFELNNAYTHGVEENKYGGFSIPVVLDDANYHKVFQLFVDHSASNKLYGTVLYLKTKELSTKNREELFNKGDQDILIHFETTGVYTRSGKRYLIFEVTKLYKLPNPDEQTPVECISPRHDYDDFSNTYVGNGFN